MLLPFPLVSAPRPSICLLCQARQSALRLRRQRRSNGIDKRRLYAAAAHAVAVPIHPYPLPQYNAFLDAAHQSGQMHEHQAEDVDSTLTATVVRPQWKLDNSPIDDLREAALGFDALHERRDVRLRVLRNLSNPWPEAPHGRHRTLHARPQSLPEASAGVVPHEIFRLRLKQALGAKAVRQVLRSQLLRCEWPKDTLRVVAVAMQNRDTAENLAALHEAIMRALYRCRQNVSDPEVLKTLSTIITRFRYAGIEVAPMLLFMALKFAARTRSLPAMRKYLKTIREQRLVMSSNVFRSVIAKFSIGWRGLGEIRNGRWKRGDLMQVLTGFDDAQHLPPEQQYHFGSFLDRSDWQYLHGWIAVLSRCKDSDTVWEEWQLWKASEARRNPKRLFYRQGSRVMTSKLRGDYWFVEQMTYSGDFQKAWKLLRETSISFRTLKTGVQDKLLESVEQAAIWNDEIRAEMVKKYDRDLSKIEAAMGVKWVPTGKNGEGQHELYTDQEEALDRLGEEGWKLDDDHGYPWETSPIVPEGERMLHEAVEREQIHGT